MKMNQTIQIAEGVYKFVALRVLRWHTNLSDLQ